MLKNTSFPFECYDQYDRVLGVKSHRWKRYEITNRYKRAVLIIRNPYENLLAYFHYRFGGKHLGYTNNKLFTNGGKYVCNLFRRDPAYQCLFHFVSFIKSISGILLILSVKYACIKPCKKLILDQHPNFYPHAFFKIWH